MRAIGKRNLLALLVGCLGLALVAPLQAEDELSGKPALDPFVVLITKPKPKRPPKRPTTFRPAAPTRKRIPQLIIKIDSIISAGDESMAIIVHDGNEYIVGKGWDGDEVGKPHQRFKVVDVDDEKIVVFDKLAKQRKTIRSQDSDSGIEIGSE